MFKYVFVRWHFLKTYFFSSATLSYELEDILDISDDIFGLGDDNDDDEVTFVTSVIFGDEPQPRNGLEMEEFRKEDDSRRRRSERLGKKSSQHFGLAAFEDEEDDESEVVVTKKASDDKSKGRKRKSLKRKSGDNKVDTSTKVRQRSEKCVDRGGSSSEESESSSRVMVPTGEIIKMTFYSITNKRINLK